MFTRKFAPGEATWNPTAAYLVPVLLLVGISMVTGLFVTEINVFYPVAIIAVMVALYAYRHYFRWELGMQWPAIAVGVGVFLLWIVLEPAPNAETVASWRAAFQAMSPVAIVSWCAWRVFGSVLVVPIAEELAFRGYIMRRLVATDFTRVNAAALRWLPLLVSSAAFAIVHQRIFAAFLAGIAYGLAYSHRGKLADAITAHAVTNGLLAAYVLAGGRWWFWI